MTEQKFIPALRFHWLTNAYDKLINLTFPEKQIKNDVIAQANIRKDENVLDFGVGTATLSIMAFQNQPSANYYGVDIDEHILKIAANKVAAAKANITLQQYNGVTLPYSFNQFDTIISSLVFHHLPTETKRIVLAELNRVLKPGGSLVIADFGKAQTTYAKIITPLFRRFDGMENTRINEEGLLPAFIEHAGFRPVKVIRNYNTAFGTMQLLSTSKTI